MARFKYNGEPPRPKMVKSYEALEFRVPQKVGDVISLKPIPPKTKFEIGKDIGYNITDSRSLRFFQADPRFTQI